MTSRETQNTQQEQRPNLSIVQKQTPEKQTPLQRAKDVAIGTGLIFAVAAAINFIVIPFVFHQTAGGPDMIPFLH